MTYVTDQTSQELRAHMRVLTSMKGWNEPLSDRLYKEILELDKKVAEIALLQSQLSGLSAARVAYASEFPPTADGNPDVDNIHAYIRGMKAVIAADRAQRQDGQEPRKCTGVEREGCNYMATCGSLCRKCGNVHEAPQPAPVSLGLGKVNELAKIHCMDYASPHHITFTVDGLRTLIEAAQGIKD